MTKFSLWLVPSGDVRRRLSKIISQLSKKYSTPIFEPHVTLIADVESTEKDVTNKTTLLANRIRPYRTTLANMDYSDNYYMPLFIKVSKTKQVTAANMKAREIFGRLSDPPYKPHLTLLYGNIDAQEKEKIIEKSGKINLSFETSQLWLVGDPADNWPKIKEFTLK